MTNYDERKIEERFHSVTVPGDMYFLQPEVAVGKAHGVETLLQKEQDVQKEARKIFGECDGVVSNGSTVSAPSATPSQGNSKCTTRG